MKNVFKHLRSFPVHTHKAISFISMIAGAVIGILMILSFVAIIGGIVWHIVFVRCPHCGHHFNPRASISNYCPECGKKLE